MVNKDTFESEPLKMLNLSILCKFTNKNEQIKGKFQIFLSQTKFLMDKSTIRVHKLYNRYQAPDNKPSK